MQLLALSQIIQNVNLGNFFIVDKHMLSFYPELAACLSGKNVYYLTDPEEQKSFIEYEKALNFFLELNISRSDHLYVIGGGATSDFGGFVAATIYRGIDWKVIPTTLLAMVDASIGGKVGINSSLGKNLIGNFHRPIDILVSNEFLASLPKEEVLSGQGEILKYAMLSELIYDSVLKEKELSYLIGLCADYKKAVVAKDLTDSSERKQLNLGHTFGHAIEKSISISHGLAVIIGIKIIVDLYQPLLRERFEIILKTFDFNLSIPVVPFEEFSKYLSMDKKSNSNNEIEVILPIVNGGFQSELKPIKSILNDLKNYEHYETFFK